MRSRFLKRRYLRRAIDKMLNRLGLDTLKNRDEISDPDLDSHLATVAKKIVADELKQDPKNLGYADMNRDGKVAAMLQPKLVVTKRAFINANGEPSEYEDRRLEPSRYETISRGVPMMKNVPELGLG